MHLRPAVAAVALVLFAPVTRLAAQSESFALAGRHHVTISAGLTASSQAATSVGTTGVGTHAGAAGLMGGIGYGYWLDERLSVGIRGLAMGVSADVAVTGSGVRVENGVVAALLVGARYQVARVTESNAVRPCVTLAAGPLVGSADRVVAGSVTTVGTVSEAVASGLVALGADLSLGRHVTLAADFGYLLAGEFSERIGSRTDYSGPAFTLSLGVLLGRGRVAQSR